MGQQQMNQLNSMHMMMNGHAMMNMQQHQGMMHQQNMMSPMSQINPTQFSTQQPPHSPQPPQQQAVLLVSNLNSEVLKFLKYFLNLILKRKSRATICSFCLASMAMLSASRFCSTRRTMRCCKWATFNNRKRQWTIWRIRLCMANHCALLGLSINTSKCPKRAKRRPTWPKITPIHLSTDSRSLAAKTFK